MGNPSRSRTRGACQALNICLIWELTPEVGKVTALLWPFPLATRMEAADWVLANIAAPTFAPPKRRTALASLASLPSYFSIIPLVLIWLFLEGEAVVAVSRRTKGPFAGSTLGDTALPLTASRHDRIGFDLAAGHVHRSWTVCGCQVEELQLVRVSSWGRWGRTSLYYDRSWCRTGAT